MCYTDAKTCSISNCKFNLGSWRANNYFGNNTELNKRLLKSNLNIKQCNFFSVTFFYDKIFTGKLQQTLVNLINQTN